MRSYKREEYMIFRRILFTLFLVSIFTINSMGYADENLPIHSEADIEKHRVHDDKW